jgi:hypothetical protein
MPKVSDTVKQSVKELRDLLKQINDGNEEDLGKLADAFYDVSTQAEAIAVRLNEADGALEGGMENGEKGGAEEEGSPNEEQQQGNESNNS